MSFDMAQFTQVFFDETQEHLATIEKVLLDLDVAAPDSEDLNAIFRAAHSIKGGAGTFGFNDMADFTHVMETLLDRLRKGELSIVSGMIDALLDAKDVIGKLLAAHQTGSPADDSVEADVRSRLTAFACLDEAPTAKVGVPPAPPVRSDRRFEITLSSSGDESGIDNLLAELGGLGVLLITSRPEAGCPGDWHLRLDTSAEAEELRDLLGYVLPADRIRVEDGGDVPAIAADSDGFGFFDDAAGAPGAESGFGFFAEAPGAPGDGASNANAGFGFFDDAPGASAVTNTALPEAAAAQAPGRRSTDTAGADGARAGRRDSDRTVTTQPAGAAMPPAGAAADSSIRVSVEKVDQLINLVGELVITQSMLAQALARSEGAVNETLATGVAQLERNSRDLQEAVMSIRMMPIAFVFSRFPRLVRDLAGKLDKQVDLKLVGEQTELDKGVIEKIADPLTHLLRNSLDHGLENRDEREASGKSAVGTISLRAFHQGGNIVIQVADDGRGLNREKILAKAKSRGMAVADDMSDGDVYSLIFEPGFSTAEVVTDVSGRGVGMDVVRRNIHALGGRVEIASQLGKGCTVSIRLPLTLAILDGMSVAVGEELYILPLGFIIESLQPTANDIRTIAGRGLVMHVRGEYLPVLRLHEAMGVSPKVTEFPRGIMVILEAEGSRVAMFVDELVGQHQVVIKSIERNYRKVSGISAATIMGDGKVAMILDVGALVRMATDKPSALHAA